VENVGTRFAVGTLRRRKELEAWSKRITGELTRLKGIDSEGQ